MTDRMKLLAGVELGGTKCICILGRGPDEILARETVPTRAREETLGHIEAILRGWWVRFGRFEALGIASFGPLDLRPRSPRYGYITSTPKPGWRDTDLVSRFTQAFDVPVGLNTDVNAAALAEGTWGGAQGLSDFAYITVGTGVGVGLIVSGQPVTGIGHPEMGHVRIARRAGEDWTGSCPFHGDCAEGLISGPAIRAQTGIPADRLQPEHSVWDTVAFALGQLLHTLVLATAPQRIFLGGGVMDTGEHLFVRVRQELRRSLNGYVQAEEMGADLDNYVGPPALGSLAGPLGALALAAQACRKPAAPGG